MGKYGHTLPGLAAQFVQEVGDPFVLLPERLSAGDRRVDVVGVPGLEVRISNVIEQHHLPFSEIQLEDARIALGVGVAAESGQPRAAREGAGIGVVDGPAGFQRGPRHGGFFFKRGFQGNVGLSVAGSDRDIGCRVAKENDFHGGRVRVSPR